MRDSVYDKTREHPPRTTTVVVVSSFKRDRKLTTELITNDALFPDFDEAGSFFLSLWEERQRSPHHVGSEQTRLRRHRPNQERKIIASQRTRPFTIIEEGGTVIACMASLMLDRSSKMREGINNTNVPPSFLVLLPI